MRDQPQDLDLPRQAPGIGLRRPTAARIALGRSGTSVSTQDHLAFQLDHACARDAVQMEMDMPSLTEKLRQRQWPVLILQSSAHAIARRTDRRIYLQRPDLGRSLSPESAGMLRAAAAALPPSPEVVFVIADGLSALAVERNAVPLLDALHPLLALHRWGSGSVCLVRDGRVAIGDEIGEVLGAALIVMLIGERPGLSASDSLGLYLTWEPRVGRTDAERNCISNVRPGGLSYAEAAGRLLSQMNRARSLQQSGVELYGGTGLVLPLP